MTRTALQFLSRKTPTIFLGLLVLCALAVAGCSSPTKQALSAELLFNGAGREVITLHDSGKLTGEPYEATAIAANAVAGQFPELEQAAKDAEAAGPMDTIQQHYHFNKLLDAVTKVLDDMTARILAARNAPAAKQ